MENLYDVAKYFLELDGRLGKMRLNRLLFYAQAWHLARHKKPLFKEDFRVWKTGHVCKELDAMFGKEYETGTENPLGGRGATQKEIQEDNREGFQAIQEFPDLVARHAPDIGKAVPTINGGAGSPRFSHGEERRHLDKSWILLYFPPKGGKYSCLPRQSKSKFSRMVSKSKGSRN